LQFSELANLGWELSQLVAMEVEFLQVGELANLGWELSQLGVS
jgi:hypothetical protein